MASLRDFWWRYDGSESRVFASVVDVGSELADDCRWQAF